MRSRREIEDVLCKADDVIEDGGTTCHSMTYEEGVSAALNWVLENFEEGPMDE